MKEDREGIVIAATDQAIADAGQMIRDGRLVAFPTETVYGLGADATNGEAIARVFEAKGRPRFNPLIVHVPDLSVARRLGHFSPAAESLARSFWPGALTLVVPLAEGSSVSPLATAGLDTVAIRVPAHPVAQALLRAAGRPLAAPSANRSGHVSPTTARHVAEDLGDKVAVILDGGPAWHGLESTIVRATDQTLALLRPGAVPASDIEALAGTPLERGLKVDTARPDAPGQLASHYAPRAHLRLDATEALPGEALLAFGPACPSTGMVINLSPSGDLVMAAANLFSSLRAFDVAGMERVAVMPIPPRGLGEAINDRLVRAAAPRG